ncbi:biliverdin-producing heme oxygenase [Pseudonocardia xishanensis]|uniref:Biliverdin-producing heme oxygenase n=1 Tax=Pseudonocardia xishanensis TaxID=630995 RepID=A0ABP8RYM7_9PSEU
MALSSALREATMAVHERAHHSTYMAALLDGRLPLEAYTLLAEQYLGVYGALEAKATELADHPAAGPFVIDELRRMPALVADVEALGGSVSAPRLLPETEVYVERLRAADAPRFVAHHYTRYLGDLAGGQIIGTLLARTYGVTGAGALFYDFSALGSPSRFRARYRALLDSAPWDEIEQRRVCDEAVRAFELNIALLDGMAATTRAAA